MAAPTTAQISLTVAGKEVWVNPPNFVSLSMKRLAGDTCNSFTLQVLDSDAFELEYALLNNTGGEISFTYKDYKNNEFKSFNGYVLKISDSYVDNRAMLTLEGFVGISFNDKFERLSFAWNVVPKFDWSKVFTDANTLVGNIDTSDQNEKDGFFEGIGNWFKNVTGQTWTSLVLLLRTVADGGANLDDLYYRFIGYDPEKVLEEIIDNLKVDKAGNYYLPNRQLTNTYEISDTKTSSNVKQSGNIIIPMKPSKLVKFIGRGGSYSELLEDDFENYKGTNFYNGDNKVSKIDWLFIKLWYKKLGSFSGCGWKVIDANIQDTDIKQADFTQTKQSFLQYINKVLLPNSTITERSKKKVKRKGEEYEQTIDTTRGNFMLSFGSDGTVYFKRVNITNTPSVRETYYLYGNDGKNAQDSTHGHLTSFSAKLDVLTSMITNGLESGGDISNKNLVTGEANQDYETTIDLEEEDSLTAFDDWGSMRVTLSSGSNSKKSGRQTLSEIQETAQTQCYEATATIEGPCTLNPQDYIKIGIIPNNVSGGLAYHHTSGNYYILSIDETIEGGRHYSKLELIKNVGSLGNTGTTTEVVKEVRIVYAGTQKSILEMQVESNSPNTKVVI